MNAAKRTPRLKSEASRVFSGSFLLLIVGPQQVDAALIVDLVDLDPDVVADVHDILNLFDAALGHLGDVQQTFLAATPALALSTSGDAT